MGIEQYIPELQGLIRNLRKRNCKLHWFLLAMLMYSAGTTYLLIMIWKHTGYRL